MEKKKELRGKLYFIGCGPGSRELITIEGEKCLKKADVIFYFPPYEQIFSDIVQYKKKYFFFEYMFNEIKDRIEVSLSNNKNVGFMVPGDLSIFSPFSGFIKIFENEIEIIPGVGTYSYFAAKLKRILNACGKIYSISILSTRMLLERKGNPDFTEYTTKDTTLIIYMNTLSANELYKQLVKIYPLFTPVFVGYNLSSPKEKIIKTNIENMPVELKGLDIENEKLITIIVGDISEIPYNNLWWDNKVASVKKDKR